MSIDSWMRRASGLLVPSACKFRFGVTDSDNKCCRPTVACTACPGGAPPAIKLVFSGLRHAEIGAEVGCCFLNNTYILPFSREEYGWCKYVLYCYSSHDCPSCAEILANPVGHFWKRREVWLKATEIRVYPDTTYSDSWTPNLGWSKTLDEPCGAISNLLLDPADPFYYSNPGMYTCDTSNASCVASAVYADDVSDSMCTRELCYPCGADCADLSRPSVPAEFLVEFTDSLYGYTSFVLCRSAACQWGTYSYGVGLAVHVTAEYLRVVNNGGWCKAVFQIDGPPPVCTGIDGLSLPRVFNDCPNMGTYVQGFDGTCTLTAL